MGHAVTVSTGLVPQSVVSWRSARQRRIATSLSDVRTICLDTLLYIDGIFTVSVIPFIWPVLFSTAHVEKLVNFTSP